MRINRQLKKVMVGFLAGSSDKEFLSTIAEALDLRRNKKDGTQEKTKRKYIKKHPVAPKKGKRGPKPKVNATK